MENDLGLGIFFNLFENYLAGTVAAAIFDHKDLPVPLGVHRQCPVEVREHIGDIALFVIDRDDETNLGFCRVQDGVIIPKMPTGGQSNARSLSRLKNDVTYYMIPR